MDVGSEGLDQPRYEILLANDPWKNYRIGPLIPVPGTWKGDTFEVDAAFTAALPAGWCPVVVRTTEASGRNYDFLWRRPLSLTPA